MADISRRAVLGGGAVYAAIKADEKEHQAGGSLYDRFEAAILAALSHLGEPVGTTGFIPSTPGFTIAVFEAKKVPIGTPLYLAPPLPAVKVKPLVWVSGYRDCAEDYDVYDYGNEWETKRYRLSWRDDKVGDFDTLEAAKAAAQADYERRIMAAIECRDATIGLLEDRIRELEARAWTIPAGWKLVPIEPSAQQATAGANLAFNYGVYEAKAFRLVDGIYRAILAAAPEPPVVCNGPAPDDAQTPLSVTGEAQAIRDAALEEAAKIVERMARMEPVGAGDGFGTMAVYPVYPDAVAKKIRALKNKEPTT